MPFDIKAAQLPLLWSSLSLSPVQAAERIVFFGVRSAVPTHGSSKRSSVNLDGSKLYNHENYRCTMMQWYVQESQVAAFLASTTPNRAFMAGALDEEGKGANLLAPGCYPYVKGPHPRDGNPTTRKAFREPDGSTKLVLRTADDMVYEWDSDKLERANVFDNIHAGGASEPYSSAGCQVLKGGYTSTGEWAIFRDRAYAISQTNFRYLLLPATVWKSFLGDTGVPRILVGSQGERARSVQQKLADRGFPPAGGADGDFGTKSGLALLKFQRSSANPLAADGICGPETASALGITNW